MSKIVNPTKVITGPGTRWSYCNAWEPKAINGVLLNTAFHSSSLSQTRLHLIKFVLPFRLLTKKAHQSSKATASLFLLFRL